MPRLYRPGYIQEKILDVLDGSWTKARDIVQAVYEADFLTQTMYSRIAKSLWGLEVNGLVEHQERTYQAKPSSRRGWRKLRNRKKIYFWRLKSNDQ